VRNVSVSERYFTEEAVSVCAGISNDTKNFGAERDKEEKSPTNPKDACAATLKWTSVVLSKQTIHYYLNQGADYYKQ
jgi:hypothetical protein